MITILLPSFNRACQLDFLLRTIFNFFPRELIHKVCIGYSYSDEDYHLGYKKLRQEQEDTAKLVDIGPQVWIDGGSQYDRFIKFLEQCDSDYVMFITDDSFFYRSFDLTKEELDSALKDDTVFGFSFRLGKNTTRVNQWNDEICQIGKLDEKSKFIWWNWDKSSAHFAHPIAIDGNLYRTSDFLDICQNADKNGFTCWEGSANSYYKNKHGNKRRMAGFAQSVLLNMPINVAEHSHSQHGLYYPRSNRDLNERYLAGEIIDYKSLDLSSVEYCQWELSLNTIKV